MTKEQKDSLTRELNGAMESGDTNRIRCAHSNILLAVMDCQMKTGDRVKALTWKLIAALGGGGGIVGYLADKIPWSSIFS